MLKRLLLVGFGLFLSLLGLKQAWQGDNHEVMRLEELPAKFHLGQLLLESQSLPSLDFLTLRRPWSWRQTSAGTACCCYWADTL